MCDRNNPCSTITAKINDITAASLIHWDRRKFTYRELLRLGGFPDNYQAKNDKIGKYMIGMSVPPRITEQVAKAVIEQWLS